jgi:hypothetical protein
MICRMDGIDKVIASAVTTTYLSFSLGTFQIQLKVTDLQGYAKNLTRTDRLGETCPGQTL